MSNNKKPIHFLVFKILGGVGIAVVITAFVLIFKGFGDFETNSFMIGSMMLPFGAIITALGIVIGFKPEFTKMRAKSIKYIQQENKEDLTDIARGTAEIMSDAVEETSRAIRNGLQSSKYCKHCGAQIDADSVFCNKCGKEQ